MPRELSEWQAIRRSWTRHMLLAALLAPLSLGLALITTSPIIRAANCVLVFFQIILFAFAWRMRRKADVSIRQWRAADAA